MKVNSNRDISFKGFYTSKTLKKSLELAEKNGALYSALVTFGLSAFARPAAIWLAPHTDKENRRLACVKSFVSSFAGLGLTLGLSLPITKGIKLIDENPKKFLNPKTISTMQAGCQKITESKSYILATQMFKLGLGLITAAPKAVLTCAGMPFVMQKVFHQPKPDEKNRNVTFRGKAPEKIAKEIGKVLDKPKVQKFSDRFKDSNFAMHIIALTDIINTAAFIHETNRSKNIREERKKALEFNAGISTGLSIASGYAADKLMDKPTEKFIKKFREANKGMPNLEKQVEGIKIAKPILLVGGIYYIIIPFISTFLAEFADKNPHLDLPHKKM